jgi:hypothetical protein
VHTTRYVVPAAMQPRGDSIGNEGKISTKRKIQTKKSSKRRKRKGDRLQINFLARMVSLKEKK